MSVSGRDPSFGYFLIPNAADPLLETAREVERRPRLRRRAGPPVPAPFRRHLLPDGCDPRHDDDPAGLPGRRQPPTSPAAVLAKTAATLDVLSGGRFELGLGAGAFWDAIEGRAHATHPRRVARPAGRGGRGDPSDLSGERSLRYQGDYYHLRGVHSGPAPAHDIGIWVGAYGPRSLRLTGRLADGWVPSIRPDVLARLAEMNAASTRVPPRPDGTRARFAGSST